MGYINSGSHLELVNGAFWPLSFLKQMKNKTWACLTIGFKISFQFLKIKKQKNLFGLLFSSHWFKKIKNNFCVLKVENSKQVLDVLDFLFLRTIEDVVAFLKICCSIILTHLSNHTKKYTSKKTIPFPSRSLCILS